MPKANRGRRPSPTKHPSHASQNFTSPEKQQEVRDRVFQSVQEMFEGRIEPEVVYMVLAEFDWQGRWIYIVKNYNRVCHFQIEELKKY